MVCTGESVNAVQRLGAPSSESVIPPAHSPAQRFLEGTLLLEWATATTQLMAVGWPRSFVAATHPRRDGLSITLADGVDLQPLLRRVLPFAVDDGLRGVPGLRAFPRQNCLELRLLGVGHDVRAHVRLLGLDRCRSREVLAGVDSASAGRRLYTATGLSSCESPLVRQQYLSAAAVLSGVLRRIPLWRNTNQLSLSHADAAVGLTWHGGSDAYLVKDVLDRSTCAIPNTRTTVSFECGRQGVQIQAVDWTRTFRAEPWETWSALRDLYPTGRLAPAPILGDTPWSRWEDPEMRAALAARDISRVFRLLRRQGVSQHQIAGLAGQSASEVSEILKGRQVMAYDVLVRIADGLGVPRGYLGLAYDEIDTTSIPEVDANHKRRKFLAHAAKVAVGAHVLANQGRKAPLRKEHAPTSLVVAAMPLSAEMFETHRIQVSVGMLRTLHREYGTHACSAAVLEVLSTARSLLVLVTSNRATTRLRKAITELERMASDGLLRIDRREVVEEKP